LFRVLFGPRSYNQNERGERKQKTEKTFYGPSLRDFFAFVSKIIFLFSRYCVSVFRGFNYNFRTEFSVSSRRLKFHRSRTAANDVNGAQKWAENSLEFVRTSIVSRENLSLSKHSIRVCVREANIYKHSHIREQNQLRGGLCKQKPADICTWLKFLASATATEPFP
jgi:hypothetical protein